ncbi:glycoprotein E [Macropodid alphaherpesvirus 4]|uniref:Envelope glycoprotein E n=1 Tax=Macropodid alphaherpesvirus 4 TaxID=2762721 RepID=A0A7L7YSF4_9ALPH|nr:glycoprotein E [Macropodid alphaherpesvirus 4]QOD40143.1 glycoprotein E [Macropodid alphaherpesvirus 4]
MRRLCFASVFLTWYPIAMCAAPRTEWKTVNQNETILLFPHQSMSQPYEKRVLSFLPLSRCSLHRPQWVSIQPKQTFFDTTVSSQCINPPMALAMQYVDLTKTDPTVTVHNDRITFNDDTISLKNAQLEDSGLYTLQSTSDPTHTSHESIFVRVMHFEPHPTGSGVLGPVEGSRHHKIHHADPVEEPLNSRHTHGVTVSLTTPNSLLFHAGSSFHTDVIIYPEAHDGQEYSLDIVWSYHPLAPQCTEMHIYESCLYHPQLPECMHPSNPACSIGTPSAPLGIKRYLGCSAYATPPNCPSTSKLHAPHGISWYEHSANLQFTNASSLVSGVYLCVVYIDEHVHAWGHIVISTADQYLNVVVEDNLPVVQLPEATGHPHVVVPPHKTMMPPSSTPSKAIRPLFYLLGVGVGLAVLGVLAGVCLRPRTRRSFLGREDKKPWSASHYIRVARGDEELYAVDDSSDSEFEQETTGVGRRYVFPKVESVHPTQEYAVATPSTPSIYLAAGRPQHPQRQGSNRGGRRNSKRPNHRAY